MPTAGTHALPPKDASLGTALTSRPSEATPRAGSARRRQWNPPPPGLFPSAPRKPSSRRPTSAAATTTRTSHPNEFNSPGVEETEGHRKKVSNTWQSVVVSPRSVNRRISTQQEPRPRRQGSHIAKMTTSPARHMSQLTDVQIEAISHGSPKRLSQATLTRLQNSNDEYAGQEMPGIDRADRRKQLTHDQQLEAAAASRRDVVRSAQVKRTLNKQDVDADTVRPLIEIAYWSPFLEVRRDAAAALSSLGRNSANLAVLSEAGALGALISMLSAGENKTDASIAYDCAQTLACMAKLDTVKLKILQAPDGVECVFGLLHSHDLRLRCIAFELVKNLVGIEELRQAIAKREGFAYMLESCTSKDSRIRLLAATILNRLAESHENRFLFYHSSHFEALATILQDPFIERDVGFRKELLSFICLLVSEEENGRKFVELNLVPTLLLILDSPTATHQNCVLVVSILECVSSNWKNHAALVAANALPKVVNLCFCSPRGLTGAVDKRQPTTARARPQTATLSRRATATRVSIADLAQLLPMVSTADSSVPAAIAFSASVPPTQQQVPVAISSEVNALLRPSFTLFCEMAKNPVNRGHVIRSKLVDYITARNLYAASDKRVRRSVITLLTFLICKERERERERDRRSTTPRLETAQAAQPTNPAAAAEIEFKHYIELLARGIIRCLFGILSGNDFSMKVDAIAAIAQLTEDTNSRITMCKPQLLRSLQEFAFHPLIHTRTNIARIIANFAERPENILKLMDEGMLAILVKYVCSISRNNDVLVEATRAIAAMSMVHVTRNKLVECGVLGTLLQFCKSPSTSQVVYANASIAIRNLRHDAAALCIQSVYRGWCVRVHHARSIVARKRRVRKMTSMRKLQPDQAVVAVMERFATGADEKKQM